MTYRKCTETGFFYVTGYSGHKYWGHTPRAAEQIAQMYFYK